MPKTLAEVKSLLKTEKVFETETSFGVNDFGKYRPNITFIIPKVFERSPLAYRKDAPTSSMLANMNVNFDGDTSVLFGDYWKSQKGGACFRPTPVAESQHVLIRVGWGGAFNRTYGVSHVDGALYYRRAASNSGRLGATYLIVPIGFVRVVRDAEIDGDAYPEAPDFEARAEEIKRTLADYHQRKEAEEAAKEKAKYDAEEASRQAKLNGLGTRVEAVNKRLLALGQSPHELTETHFGRTYNYRLYTELNVTAVEREVTAAEAEKVLSDALRELENGSLAAEVKEAECTLSVPAHSSWSGSSLQLTAPDVSCSRSFSRSLEGIEKLRQTWPEFRAEVESKRREVREAAEKEAEEQRLIREGCPTDFTCHHERGRGKTHRQCWVIQPDGKEREADEQVYRRYKHVATKWNVVRPGEIALMWEKSSRASEHRFTVVHMLTENLTEAQIETLCALLEGIEQQWEGACGLASGSPSPDVGQGWLHPTTGESLTPGFQTSRQLRESGQSPMEQPDVDTPIKAVRTTQTDSNG